MDADPDASDVTAWKLAQEARQQLHEIGQSQPVFELDSRSLFHEFCTQRALHWSLLDGDAAVLWRMQTLRADPKHVPSRRMAADRVGLNLAIYIYVHFPAASNRAARRWVEGTVLGVAFSPDGNTIATASSDKTARLWDAKDGQPMGMPMTHKDWVLAVAFSPDGAVLVTATDRTVYQFDIRDGVSITGSRRLDGAFPWSASPRFLDETGNAIQVPVLPTGNSVDIQTIHFDSSDLEPLTGDAEELLKEWQQKLGLCIDEETGAVVPLHKLAPPASAPHRPGAPAAPSIKG